ncbi:distal tail protein Dit [Lacticaseibacillus paracasei]|uniref:distal tail protein Dit n=1 Tax=Lacticaseibacillus paracasei TaxID=1597 RepID=UPI0030CFA470
MKKEITVKYGDFDLSPYFIVSSVTMPFLYKDNQYTQIGRSDGESLLYSRNAKTKITIQGTILTQETNLTVAETKDELINALKSDTIQQLTLSNYPGRYFNAIFDGSQDFDGTFDYIATVELVFTVPDGIAHSVATQTADNMPYKDTPVNLVTGSGGTFTGWSGYTSIVHWFVETMAFAPNASSKVLAAQSFTDNSNSTVYTFSFLAKADTAGDKAHCELFGSVGASDFTLTTSWQTFTAKLTYTTARRVYVGAAQGNKGSIYIARPKLEVGTTASPWSPNPADPEYYSDTITVHNGGTYPSEPVITATINGDDGVLTAMNDQGSVLQFGSRNETDGFVKQKSERVYHLDFNQTPTGVTLNNGVTAFPYYEHGNNANVQSGPFGYKDGIAYPSTERTAGNFWNGPSISGTIPPNSNGSNTANFQFVNRVNVGTNAAEVGRFEFNLTYQGKIVASLALFDDSASNDQWVFSGTVYDGSQAQMLFFDLLPRNYYRDGNYNAVITKMGDQLTFRLDRIDLGDGGIETRTVSGFSKVPIDGWTAWFPGFSDQRGWSINWQDSYFEWINVDYWDDIPNRFKDGDVVQIDVANRRVLVNGAEDRTLQTIGNDWGGFKIQPGNNTIELLTSSWAKQCKAEVSWQEAWL